MKKIKGLKTKIRRNQPSSSSRDDDLKRRLATFSASGEQDLARLWEEQEIERRDSLLREKQEKRQKAHKKEQLKKKLKKTLTQKPKLSKNKFHIRRLAKNLLSKAKENKRPAVGVILILLMVVVFLGASISRDTKSDTLGESESKTFSSDTLPREQPKFQLLFPTNSSTEDYEVLKVSPEGSAPVYTYLDKIGEVGINVSQQEIPPKLKEDQVAGLEALAKDFQASNVIRLNEQTVYHGFNERARIQSIIFIKNNLLVLVRAEQSLSDDQIVGFVLSLN